MFIYCQMSWNPENCVIHVLWINLFVLGVHFLGLHLVLTLSDKCLSKVAATVYGILKFPWAPWDRSEVWYFSWRWLCHGVLTRFPRSSMAFLRRSSWRLPALSRQFYCVHGVVKSCTASSRSSHCADSVLFTFGGSWNNWQGPHIAGHSWAYVTRKWQCINRQPLSRHTWTQRLLRLGVLLHPASIEHSYRQAVALLDGAHQ